MFTTYLFLKLYHVLIQKWRTVWRPGNSKMVSMDYIGLSMDRTPTWSNYVPRDGWYEGPESNSFFWKEVQQGFLHGFLPHTPHIFDGVHSRHL